MSEKKGWKTVESKSGEKLESPFYATNQKYIEAHHTWIWQEVPYEEAAENMWEPTFSTPDEASE